MDNSRYPEKYGEWAGNPKGDKPNFNCCATEVFNNHRFFQCSRKRGYGPDQAYCKQHAKKYDEVK